MMKKRIISMLLAIVMVVGMVPATAFAAAGDNLCDHHTEHTADCGYVAAVEGSPCTHAHDEACGYVEAVEEVLCACVAAEDGTLTHTEGCGYVAPVAGSDCTHVHDEACGYVEAAAEVPCGYVCEESHEEEPSEEPSEEPGEEPDPFCTCAAICAEDAPNTACDLCAQDVSDCVGVEVDTSQWLYPILEFNYDNYEEDGSIVYAETVSGAVRASASGVAFNSPGFADFSGTGGVIYTPDDQDDPLVSMGDSGTTVSLWVNYTDGDTFNGLFAYGTETDDDFQGFYLQIPGSPVTDQWYLIAVVEYANGAQVYYVNGVRVGSRAPVAGQSLKEIAAAGDAAYYIGGSGFTGRMDRFCVYDRARTDAEIAGEYNRDIRLYDTELLSWVSLNVTCTGEITIPILIGNPYALRAAHGSTGTIESVQFTVEGATVKSFEFSENFNSDTGYTCTVDSNTVTLVHSNLEIEAPSTGDMGSDTELLWLTLEFTDMGEHLVDFTNLKILSGNNADITSVITTQSLLLYYFDHSIDEEGVCIYCGETIEPDDGGETTEPDAGGDSGDTTEPDDGGDGGDTTEPVTLTIGDNGFEDGKTYTYTAEQDGTLYINITEIYYGETGTVTEPNLNNWVAVTINGTAITAFDNTLEVSAGDTVTIAVESLDSDTYHGTISLSWGAPVPDEPTEPATLTGVTITVDGTTYGVGETAIITPDTQSIVYTVTGENFAGLSEDNKIWFCKMASGAVNNWEINAAANTATTDLSANLSWFESCTTPFEVQLSNDGGDTWTGTGVYVQYVSGEPTEPDAGGDDSGDSGELATITGVSITVDGVTYTEGNVTITPTSTIVYTVSGTNFANVSADNLVNCADGSGETLNSGWWIIDEASNTATMDITEKISWFVGCDNFKVRYTNDGQQSWVETDIYLTYDDGIAEEDKAVIEAISITVDGVSYTEGNVTITPTSTIVYTVSGTNLANVSADNLVSYADGSRDPLNNGMWIIDETSNTATVDFSEYISWFASCDNFEVTYSNDGLATEIGTGIYLTYDDGTTTEPVEPATITGMSITIDGVTYDGADTSAENPAVIPSDAASVILTVHGTNLNTAEDNWVSNMPAGNYNPIYGDAWTKNADGTEASTDLTETLQVLTKSLAWEIKYSNTDGSLEDAVTGLYVQYVKQAAEPIVITKQPESVEVEIGERFVITVEAQGEGLTYQWYYLNRNADTWMESVYKGTTYSMTMAEFCHGREVYCVITDENGNSVTTETAAMTRPPIELKIITQPQDVQVEIGEKATITFQVQGEGLSYQWYYKNKNGTEFAASCFKSKSYSMTMAEFCHARQVYCVVTDMYGNQVTTDVATMTRPPQELVIVTQPESVYTEIGGSVRISVAAQGDGLTYQWYYKNTGDTGFKTSVYTGKRYSMTLATWCDGREVYCVIKDQYGNEVTTQTVGMYSTDSET